MRLNSPPAIVERAQKQEYVFELPRNFESPDEALQWQLFHQGNPLRGHDGRTYYEYRDGKYLSHFVSQYSSIIYDNVEPGVRDLVRALHDKGYLTFGSCQSHSRTERRWVGLAFWSEQSRDSFVNVIRSADLPVHFQYETEQERGIKLNLKFDQTRYWNIMFCRRYDRYYPIWMLICGLPFEEETWSLMRILRTLFYTRILKPFFVNRVTEKLTDFIRSAAVKNYDR